MSRKQPSEKHKLLLKVLELTCGNWYLEDCCACVDQMIAYDREADKEKTKEKIQTLSKGDELL